MAAAKGYCFGWNLPMALVPTLEALASRFPGEKRVLCPVLDARKKEVYAALFRREGDALARLTPDLALPPEALLDRLPEGEIVFCGDGLKSYGPMFLDRLGGQGVVRRGAGGPPVGGRRRDPRRKDLPRGRRRGPAFGGARVHPAFRGGIQAPPSPEGSPEPLFMSGWL